MSNADKWVIHTLMIDNLFYIKLLKWQSFLGTLRVISYLRYTLV